MQHDSRARRMGKQSMPPIAAEFIRTPRNRCDAHFTERSRLNGLCGFLDLFARWMQFFALRPWRLCIFLIVGSGYMSPLFGASKTNSAPTADERLTAIDRGVRFLVGNQSQDGSWGTAHKTKDLNIYAPVPGAHHAFRCAVTAMCVESLIETGAANRMPDAKKALEKGEAWLLENLPQLRRADGTAIYNVWGHAYGIQALVAMYQHSKNDEYQKRIKGIIVGQIGLLRKYESVDGGWAYYDMRIGTQRPASDSLSFVTATVLVAFDMAKKIGVEIPADLVKRGVDSIQRQRKSDGSFLYGEYLKWRPMLPVNRTPGSLGRSPTCSLALLLWGDKTITQTVLTKHLDKLVTRNGWLSIGRKRPVPHESWFQVAGYFYYYGHYYAALCLEHLDAKKAVKYRDDLSGLLLPLQEKDGSWWDYPFYDYHQPYGTAFALMSLAQADKAASR